MTASEHNDTDELDDVRRQVSAPLPTPGEIAARVYAGGGELGDALREAVPALLADVRRLQAPPVGLPNAETLAARLWPDTFGPKSPLTEASGMTLSYLITAIGARDAQHAPFHAAEHERTRQAEAARAWAETRHAETAREWESMRTDLAAAEEARAKAERERDEALAEIDETRGLLGAMAEDLAGRMVAIAEADAERISQAAQKLHASAEKALAEVARLRRELAAALLGETNIRTGYCADRVRALLEDVP